MLLIVSLVLYLESLKYISSILISVSLTGEF